MNTVTIRASEIRKGDWLATIRRVAGHKTDGTAIWELVEIPPRPVAQVQILKSGHVSVRLASGSWGATSGTYQDRIRFDAADRVEVTR